MKARFQIGTTFIRYSNKYPHPETIVDILTTTNSHGDIVGIRYVTEHEFCGQAVTDRNVCDTTIARSLRQY